ncbi:MAG: hypothetical protein OHK93_005969 [Ramalina farinacea]|uniref:AB hydrolase-1 domain-containing protein n=1 Tax=Ramalina farinacea TaxID=258253 RepID=A0AA43QJY1_9LECA|nr:hypothetical protein [Ramalina farinacea]
MSPPTNPTIVLVPGAWQPSSLYTPLITAFKNAGFPTFIVDLPSCEPQVDPQTTTVTIDADAIRQVVLPLIEQEGKDVVLLCHSYGGVPLGPAAAGLSKSTRGSNGGVVGLVYMCAAVVHENASMLEAIGGEYFPYMIPNSVSNQSHFQSCISFILEASITSLSHLSPRLTQQSSQPGPHLATIKNGRSILFNDIDDTAAATLVDGLVPHSTAAFESKVSAPAWAEDAYRGRLAYLRTTKDEAFPSHAQDHAMQSSGVGWAVSDLEAGHAPYASCPERVVEAVGRVIGGFGG